MKRGDIYLANFPFGDTGAMKLRPVLLLTGPVGSVPEVLVAYISSVLPRSPLNSDVILDPSTPDGLSTRLKMTSVLRLHKLATSHQRNLVHHLGSLAAATGAEVGNKLRSLLNV